MPAAQLTYKPWNAAALAYGAAQTKSFAAWGINDQFSGALKSQTPDELNLSLVGDALAPIPFVYRSILKVALDGKPFFTGYVTEDLDREGMPNKNNGQVKVEGPWWFLENLVYQLNIPILTGVVNNAPIWVNSYWTHFTLNMPMVPAFTSTAEFLFPVVSYGVQYWNSQQQLKDILEYAIANGAYLQYKLADIINIPVLPADVMNITCAEAIRRQIEAVDAVVWFDHTQDPPAFHCQQRSALGARTVTVGAAPVAGAAGAATGFKLKEMFDRRVPYVLINFQEPVSVAGVSGVINVQQMYPNPLPADNLKGLITTVPIRAINGTTQKKFIQTDTVDPDDLAWWLLRFPKWIRTRIPTPQMTSPA